MLIDRQKGIVSYHCYELFNSDNIKLLNDYYAERGIPIYYIYMNDSIYEKIGIYPIYKLNIRKNHEMSDYSLKIPYNWDLFTPEYPQPNYKTNNI